MHPESEIVICKVSPDDAIEAAELSSELGYEVALTAIKERLARFSALDEQSVFGAYIEGRLVGWIEIAIAEHLVAGRRGEIAGLVVSNKFQRLGIGRLLLQKAEDWMARHHVDQLVVRSQTTREGAHAFYERQNFRHTKTSTVFAKSLSAPQAKQLDR